MRSRSSYLLASSRPRNLLATFDSTRRHRPKEAAGAGGGGGGGGEGDKKVVDIKKMDLEDLKAELYR